METEYSVLGIYPHHEFSNYTALKTKNVVPDIEVDIELFALVLTQIEWSISMRNCAPSRVGE